LFQNKNLVILKIVGCLNLSTVLKKKPFLVLVVNELQYHYALHCDTFCVALGTVIPFVAHPIINENFQKNELFH